MSAAVVIRPPIYSASSSSSSCKMDESTCSAPSCASITSSSSVVSSSDLSTPVDSPLPPPINFVGLGRYLKQEKLGEGNYGCVYKAKDKETGEWVALKRIKLDEDDDGVPSTAIREISLLQDLNHPNVIQLREVIFEYDRLYLVFPFLDKDLRRFMDCVGDLPPNCVKFYIYQTLMGIGACHERRVLHRDLKPQNVLVDREGNIKIADFGLARSWNSGFMRTITHEVATLWYRAPEILMGSRTYTAAVDMWAIGCMLAELSADDPLFPGDSEITTLFLMFQLLGTASEENWAGVEKLADYKGTFPQWKCKGVEHFTKKFPNLGEYGIDLLKRLLTFDPEKRISAKAALTHPFFFDLDVPKAIEQSKEISKQLDTNDGAARRAKRHAKHE